MGQGGPVGGGTQLGQATGSIVINTQQLAQAQQQVQAHARQMTQAFNNINPSINQLQAGLGGLNASLRSLAAGFGVGFGAQGAVQLVRAAVAAEQLATAYRRQSVAAADLAGSQSQLNDLLQTYDRVTGNALDDATLLANVLNLQATGFGKNVEQLERFARAARGISIGTGRGQASTNQQLIFELANQTGFRLDQLGLDMQAVEARAEALRAANANLSKEQAYQNAVLDEAIAKYGKLLTSAEGQATGIEKLASSWNNLGLAIGEAVSGPLDAFGKGASLLIDVQIARLRAWMEELDAYILLLRQVGMAGPWLTSGERRFVSSSVSRDIGRHGGGGGGSAGDSRFDDSQNAAIRDWARSVTQIERQAAAERLQVTRDYEQQRSSAIREYEQSIARDAQAFALQRARAEQDQAEAIADVRRAAAQREMQQAEELARSLAQARSDSADRLADLQENLDRTVGQRRADSQERIAEWVEDRDKAIAERREDSNERLLELENDFNRARARAESDHKLRLNEAASRLDARSIFFEQARFEQQAKDALQARDEQVKEEKSKLDEAIQQLEDAHNERLQDEAKALDKSIAQARDAYNRQVQDEKEALEKRIQQAQEAYAQQLENARLADAERIADMEADFLLRKQREDEDRAIRLGQQAQDYQEQLGEMAKAQRLRLAQITRHAQEERTQLDTEFLAQLADLKIHVDGWAAENTRATDEAIKQFDRWIKHVEETLAIPGHPSEADPYPDRPTPTPTQPGVNPDGGAAPVQPSPNPYAAMRSFIYPTQVATAATGTGGRGGLSFRDINIAISGASTDSPRDFAEQFRVELVKVLRGATGAYRG